jgi:hypothetical protein
MVEVKCVQWRKSKFIALVLLPFITTLLITACERDTQLKITGGNQPTFLLSGSGTMGSLRLRGPQKQREADGEAAFLYWFIDAKDKIEYVEALGTITYGKVPKGYRQVYPEDGEARCHRLLICTV